MSYNIPSGASGVTPNSFSRRIMLAISMLLACIFIALVIVFARTYGENVPLNDQAFYSLPIAVEAANGNFSFSSMLTKNNGNRLLWTNLITYALAVTTHWNIHLEAWVSLIVAGLIFIVFIKLAEFDLKYAMPLIVILFAALVFSLNQQLNWIWGPHNSSFFFVFFFLLAVLVIRQKSVGWRALILAALFCFCSLFSLQQGIVSWPAMVIVLLARGYRGWKFYTFWIGVTVLSIALFTSHTAVGSTLYQAISIPENFIQWVIFILALFGTPIVTNDLSLAAFMGFILLLLLAANLIYLGVYKQRWLFVGVWTSLAAFSGAIAFLISIGRLDMSGIERASSTWYITHSLLAWTAVIAMSTESIHLLKQRLFRRNRPLFRLVSAAGYLLLIGFSVNYAVANFKSLLNTVEFFQIEFGADRIGINETCMLLEPLTQNDCYWHVSGPLLKHQLAAFAQPTRVTLLPDDYKFGDVIVFDSQELDLHLFIDRVWFPDAIDNVYHIMPESSMENPQILNSMTAEDASKLMDKSASQLWYISSNANTNKAGFSELINKHYIYESELVDGQLQIVRYRHR